MNRCPPPRSFPSAPPSATSAPATSSTPTRSSGPPRSAPSRPTTSAPLSTPASWRNSSRPAPPDRPGRGGDPSPAPTPPKENPLILIPPTHGRAGVRRVVARELLVDNAEKRLRERMLDEMNRLYREEFGADAPEAWLSWESLPRDSTYEMEFRLSAEAPTRARTDRKSTRLNSSHVASSYAVFCVKNKKPIHES